MSMSARKVEQLFELRQGGKYVPDYFAGMIHKGEDKKFKEALMYYFGFAAKDGDIVCAILLRQKPKKSRKY